MVVAAQGGDWGVRGFREGAPVPHQVREALTLAAIISVSGLTLHQGSARRDRTGSLYVCAVYPPSSPSRAEPSEG